LIHGGGFQPPGRCLGDKNVKDSCCEVVTAKLASPLAYLTALVAANAECGVRVVFDRR
jgi:hypothetical protein